MTRKNFLYRTFWIGSGLMFRPVRFLQAAPCITSADVAGPFHRDGAPFRNNLADGYSKSVKGEWLEVTGRVMSDCETPLPEAVLDLWHADPTGEYDMTSDLYLFRARVKMDNNGYYYYRTLIPAPYRDGGLNRPKHIHYIVTAPGHRTLTTQLYFKGDERLDTDTFVNQNNGWSRAMPFTKNHDGVYQMHFDVFLQLK